VHTFSISSPAAARRRKRGPKVAPASWCEPWCRRCRRMLALKSPSAAVLRRRAAIFGRVNAVIFGRRNS
jgi:hypothetical protein